MNRIAFAMLLAAAGGATTLAAQTPPGAMGWGGRGMMRADTNGDGVVTRDEAMADAVRRFAAIDTNHDGVLSADELAAAPAMMGWRHGNGGDQPPPPPGGLDQAGGAARPRMGGMHEGMTLDEAKQRAMMRFDRMDANHDGRLDPAELAAGRPMGGHRGGFGGDDGQGPPPPPAGDEPQP